MPKHNPARSEDFFLALRQARKATHRGDIDTAERWMRMAQHHLVLAQNFADLKNEDAPTRRALTPRRFR
jgi:hypothetical protein